MRNDSSPVCWQTVGWWLTGYNSLLSFPGLLSLSFVDRSSTLKSSPALMVRSLSVLVFRVAVKRIKSVLPHSWRGLALRVAGIGRKWTTTLSGDIRRSCLTRSTRPGPRLMVTCSCWKPRSLSTSRSTLLLRMAGPGMYLSGLVFSLNIFFRKKPRLELEVPGQAICDVNKAIMVDEDTADFTLRCETREFKVHKSFLCSRLVQTKPATISII